MGIEECSHQGLVAHLDDRTVVLGDDRREHITVMPRCLAHMT
jgi:hypothetical protein